VKRILNYALCLWVACAGARSQTPDAATPPAYILNPGDVIEVRFYLNAELNEQVQIRPDGRISMQLVGEVVIGGLPVAEASRKIEELFAKELREPKATIQVRQFSRQRVFVTGEVVRPGPLNMSGEMTILEAISEAGGIRRTAADTIAVLVRKGADGAPFGRKLKLMQKGSPTAEAEMVLEPFDVVLIPESKIARLDRWIDQHIRQIIPINANAGFTYLIQGQGGGSIPIF
jgi:polysaccharide biosynthesis/export protein